jgi:hypothetical protein
MQEGQMSKDGWLPPGVTDEHIDEHVHRFEPEEPDEQERYLINLERDRHSFLCIFDRLREEMSDDDWLRVRLAEMVEQMK